MVKNFSCALFFFSLGPKPPGKKFVEAGSVMVKCGPKTFA
jgi:hypothetical protein